MNQDQIIYEKAKKIVNRNHWTVFFIVLIYFITFYLIFQLKFMEQVQFAIHSVLIASFLSELCLYGLLFTLLSTGKKFARWLYSLGNLYSFALLFIPAYYLINDYFHIIPYIIWIVALFIKNIGLLKYGGYLRNNRWAKVYYDHEIEIEDDEDIENYYLKSKNKTKDEEPFTLPQLCLRLGICVYGSLLVFPIFMQIFASLFESNDLQSVFAIKDMFLFCIYSAVIWTIPIFLFYYSHPFSKKSVGLCFILECVRILFYAKTLFQYFTQNLYPVRVYIFFIIVDIIRYILILISIYPIFKKEE
ncbi:hypothetical protein [Floccifex sp.]|uniref:hypothetical protein n=1 Tax=Floccifex sp. TaxID=2815810 RepID=UPI002A75A089|nr:hypothetical protein [Floccifex sp.]MDD7281875.1 hypothetical protein [Erysipelotrichaceae bacterium]MDY2958118.1 hypothetical protein [Floccifex sp.]